MVVGVVPNIEKENILKIVSTLLRKLTENGFEYILSNSLSDFRDMIGNNLPDSLFLEDEVLCAQCDLIISIGGDGTMLSTAFKARNTLTPMAGLNLGKLGFLAEYDVEDIDRFLDEIKRKDYIVGSRMALEASCVGGKSEHMYALNDIVIDKGGWPKMIELTVKVDNDYVGTFSADGLIIATPTGSTGYSLSTGGPIVSPKSDAITLAPIAPHSLTMRPIVISGHQSVQITVQSQHTNVFVNCDGQRVEKFKPPFTLEVHRSKDTLRLIHTKSINYFEILRKKFFWGLDIRRNNGIKGLDND